MKFSEGKDFKAIAVCMAKFDNTDQRRFIENFYRACKANNYKVFIFSSMVDFYYDDTFEEGEKKIFDLMEPEKFDAVVLLSLTFKKFQIVEDIAKRVIDANVPCISIARDIEGCVNVSYDFGNYFEEVVSHIVEYHGVKKVNFIAGMRGNSFSDERLEVYKKVLRKNNIPIEEDRIGYGDFWEGPTAQVMDEFLSSGKEIQAIICANDYMAMEACRKLREAGLRVPEDVMVSGFDGVELERSHYPRLCTSATDDVALSGKVAEIIHDIFEGKAVDKEYFIGCKLQLGQSCGCMSFSNSPSDFIKMGNRYFLAHKHERSITAYIESMFIKIPVLSNRENMAGIWGDLLYYVREYVGGDFYLAFNSDFLNDDMEIWPHVRPMEFDEGHHYYTDRMQIPISYRKGNYTTNFSIDREQLIPHLEEQIEEDGVILFLPIRVQKSTEGYIASCFIPENFEYFMLYSFTMNMNSVIEMQKYRIDHQNLYSTDQLTKLLNRKGFYLHMEPRIQHAIKEKEEVAVISIDMNWLKQINDTFGHKEGDFALAKISEIMEKAAKDIGVCTRFGGDEFAIAFAAENAASRAEEMMKEIVSDLEEFNNTKEKPYPLSVSMGYVAYVPDETRTLESYIVEADRLMYKDKKKYKDTHSWEGI